MTEPVQNDEKKPSIALNLAGVGYAVGDVTMAQAAKLRGESNVFNGAAIWLAGGLAAARYGHPDKQKQMEMFSAKLENHLREQGVEIPDDVRERDALLKKPSFIQRCENFLYQHPSEMLNAAYAIGATFLLKDGVKELRAGTKKLLPTFEHGFNGEGLVKSAGAISKNFWMGALVGGGALSGLLIKEDPQAREHAKGKGIIARAAAYIQEKPLRLTGTLYGANNIFTVLKAFEDYSNRAKYSGTFKPHHFSGMTAGTYILSNILLSTVSRDTGSKSFTSDQVAKLEQAAVQIIAAQPEEQRHDVIRTVANYMANQKEIGRNALDISLELSERLARVMEPETMAFSDRQEAAANAIAALPLDKQQESIAQATKQLVASAPENSGLYALLSDPKLLEKDLVRMVDMRNRNTHPNEKDGWVAREQAKYDAEFAAEMAAEQGKATFDSPFASSQVQKAEHQGVVQMVPEQVAIRA